MKGDIVKRYWTPVGNVVNVICLGRGSFFLYLRINVGFMVPGMVFVVLFGVGFPVRGYYLLHIRLKPHIFPY